MLGSHEAMKRKHRHLRWLSLAGLAALLAGIAGCQALAAPWLMWGKEPTKHVPAEYPYLADKNVLILVWAEQDTLFDYPYVQYELSEYVRHALETHVKDVKCVPSKPVAQMQRQEPDWDQVHAATFAKRFKADRVLLIELLEYGTREPGSPHLFRGRISANVKVYDPSYGTSVGPVYEPTGGAVTVEYPEDGPGAWGTDDLTIRRQTMELFALELAGKFYDREVKVE